MERDHSSDMRAGRFFRTLFAVLALNAAILHAGCNKNSEISGPSSPNPISREPRTPPAAATRTPDLRPTPTARLATKSDGTPVPTQQRYTIVDFTQTRTPSPSPRP